MNIYLTNPLFSFLGISQSLPSTSYIKLIEIWMLFAMIYPSAEILLVCLKDAYKTKTLLVKGTDKDLSMFRGQSNAIYQFSFIINPIDDYDKLSDLGYN